MASYYKHKATHSRKIPYSFQCEHCVKDSGTILATISGNEAQYDSPHKTLTEKQTETLNRDAHNFLVNRVYRDYVNATEKKIFALSFKDVCPHCQKPQSWAVSGMKNDLMTWPIALIVVGIIAALGTYFFTDSKNIMLSVMIGGAFVLAAAFIWIYKSIKIKMKMTKASSALQKNIPTIDWSVADDLINEKLVNIGK